MFFQLVYSMLNHLFQLEWIFYIEFPIIQWTWYGVTSNMLYYAVFQNINSLRVLFRIIYLTFFFIIIVFSFIFLYCLNILIIISRWFGIINCIWYCRFSNVISVSLITLLVRNSDTFFLSFLIVVYVFFIDVNCFFIRVGCSVTFINIFLIKIGCLIF